MIYHYAVGGIALESTIKLTLMSFESKIGLDHVYGLTEVESLGNQACWPILKDANKSVYTDDIGNLYFDFFTHIKMLLDFQRQSVQVVRSSFITNDDISQYFIDEVLKYIYIHMGIPYIHAGAVSGKEGIVGFAGPSCAGKSTLSAYLSEQGYRFVTDDGMPVFHRSYTQFYTYASNIGLKLRSESISYFHKQHAYAGQHHQERNYAIQVGPADSILPVKALALLRSSTSRPTTFQPAKRIDAINDIITHCFHTELLTWKLYMKNYKAIAAFYDHVPVYYIDYYKSFDSLEIVKDKINTMIKPYSDEDEPHAEC